MVVVTAQLKPLSQWQLCLVPYDRYDVSCLMRCINDDACIGGLAAVVQLIGVVVECEQRIHAIG